MHKNLHIFSATFVEKFPGYIYIEAEREIHVKDAIGDLNGTTFKGRAYCRIIPIKEVPSIFLAEGSKFKELERGQWVRVKKAPYNGDIAQVINPIN